MQYIALLCSLIIISGWYVILLYIIIELSYDPETNLPSFKIAKHKTVLVWIFNLWIGFFNLILKSLYKLSLFVFFFSSFLLLHILI